MGAVKDEVSKWKNKLFELTREFCSDARHRANMEETKKLSSRKSTKINQKNMIKK